MPAIDRLFSRYPDSPVVQTTIRMEAPHYAAQVAKAAKSGPNPAEGGTFGIVWMYDGSIPLVKRLGKLAGWALPGGTVEHGEDFGEAFVREIWEETGVAADISRLLLVDRRTFVSPDGEQHRIDLAVFEAIARLGQVATTTAIADSEHLKVETFRVTDLPETMLFYDRKRIDLALQDPPRRMIA